MYQDSKYRELEKSLSSRIEKLFAQYDDLSDAKAISDLEKQYADILSKHDRLIAQMAKFESDDKGCDDFEITIGGEAYET